MIYRIFFFMGLSVLPALAAMAEVPNDFRSEQIFLAPQKSVYAPGDSILVRGKIMSIAADGTEPYSRYAYLELISDRDTAVVRKKVACDDAGNFATFIHTLPSARKGTYVLRAYTNLMRNFSPESFAHAPLLIGRDFPEANDIYGGADSRCTICADGGVLVAEAPQSVSAYLRSGSGVPLSSRSLALTDSRGDTVATAVTSPSGLASFYFIPAENEAYTVRYSQGGNIMEFPAPAVCPDTLKLQAYLTGKRLKFNILGAKPVPDGARLYAFDRLNGISEISFSGKQGVAALPQVPRAVTLFLTDSLLHPLAECSAAPRYSGTDSLMMATDVTPGQRLDFSTALVPDSTRTVVARIIPAGDFITPGMEQALLYEADLTSPLPFPTRLPDSPPSVRNVDLQAWISTAKFSRFALTDAVNHPDSVYVLTPETRMTIDGVALHNAITGTTFGRGYMVAYNNKLRRTYDAPIDSKGRFSIPVDDFEDETDFFLQAINESNEPELATLDLMDYAYPSVPKGITGRYVNETSPSAVRRGTDDKTWNIQLRDVVVTARRPRTEHPNIDSKKYFGARYVDRETIEKRHYINLLQILQSMPLVDAYLGTEEGNDGNPNKKYVIRNKRGIDTFNKEQGKIGLKVLVDGSLYPEEFYNMLMEMHADEIESVEMFSPGESTSRVAFGMGGVLEITTRNFGIIKPRPSKGTLHELPGLARSADFDEANALTVPDTPGAYRLVVDIADSNGIRTLACPFEVR